MNRCVRRCAIDVHSIAPAPQTISGALQLQTFRGKVAFEVPARLHQVETVHACGKGCTYAHCTCDDAKHFSHSSLMKAKSNSASRRVAAIYGFDSRSSWRELLTKAKLGCSARSIGNRSARMADDEATTGWEAASALALRCSAPVHVPSDHWRDEAILRHARACHTSGHL
jgi:hypothetical protein